MPSTVKTSLDVCIQKTKELLESSDDDATRRDFALAITHMEDAQMRYGRARARQVGMYAPFDFDRYGSPEAVAQALTARDLEARTRMAAATEPPTDKADDVGEDPEPPARHAKRGRSFPT